MSRLNKSRRSPKQGHAGFLGIKIGILLAVIAAVSAVVFLTGAKSSNVSAMQKKYKGTRAIVVDNQTGQRRVPTQEEVDEVVANLSQLANRPEDLPSTQSGGAEVVDLAGGYNGVMLGRPADDGSWETLCVFTFEEGAEFLGLIENISAE
jgi:hypothetical protein